MRKKHIIAAAAAAACLILSGSLFLLFHDKPEEGPTLNQIVEEKFNAYETDLRDSLGSMNNNTDVGNYLLSWAKNKQIAAVSDAAGNIIYNIPASDMVSDSAQPAAIFCSYDASNMEAHIEEISAALTIAKSAENNGSIQIFFLAEDLNGKTEAQLPDTSHFAENTAVFCLGKTASYRISTVTGGYQHIRISDALHYTEPTYGKAYKIEVKNCPDLSISGKYTAGMNPIKTLGSVLANFKSTSLLFELSSFRGGTDEMITPSKASMIVVINESDTAKFEKKLNNSIDKFYEKYHEDYPEIEYTYEETGLPSKVIEGDDTDNLVSLMYTAFNGVYNRDDEGTIIALANIGKLSTKNGRLKIDTAVMCCDESIMDEISEVYETICGLCDMKFEIRENIPIYNGAENEMTLELVETFRNAYTEFTGKSVVEESTAILTSCSSIHESNPEIPILFCGITSKAKQNIAGSIITWLDQSDTIEE